MKFIIKALLIVAILALASARSKFKPPKRSNIEMTDEDKWDELCCEYKYTRSISQISWMSKLDCRRSNSDEIEMSEEKCRSQKNRSGNYVCCTKLKKSAEENSKYKQKWMFKAYCSSYRRMNQEDCPNIEK